MPKRTNDFQKLVLRIYNQLRGQGGTVQESAMLKERNSNAEREVDILLEQKAFGTRLLIGVECRGRSRRGDVEWIDGLIGKYHDLPVKKIIAVSSSGFSKTAKQKAEAHNIEALHLQEALANDWPAEFCQVGMGLITRTDKPMVATLNIGSALDFDLTGSAVLHDADGNQLGLASALPHIYYQKLNANLEEFLASVVPKVLIRNKSADVAPLQWHFGTPLEPPCFFKREDGVLIQVRSIKVDMLSTFQVEDVPLKHYVLGDSQFSIAEVETTDGKISFDVVQQAGEPLSVHVNTEKVKLIDARDT